MFKAPPFLGPPSKVALLPSTPLQCCPLKVHGVPEHPDVPQASILCKDLHLNPLNGKGVLAVTVGDPAAPVVETHVQIQGDCTVQGLAVNVVPEWVEGHLGFRVWGLGFSDAHMHMVPERDRLMG